MVETFSTMSMSDTDCDSEKQPASSKKRRLKDISASPDSVSFEESHHQLPTKMRKLNSEAGIESDFGRMLILHAPM